MRIRKWMPFSLDQRQLITYCVRNGGTAKMREDVQRLYEERKKTPEYERFCDMSPRFFNRAQWGRLRQAFMSEVDGLCQNCMHRSLSKLGNVLDHIIPRLWTFFDNLEKSDEEIFDMWMDESNLQFLCGPCHKYKLEQVEDRLEKGRDLTNSDRILFHERGYLPNFEEWIKKIKKGRRYERTN